MNNEIILSICIPTYNRSDRLKKCLYMLADEIKIGDVRKHVEIVVIDNASTDDTSLVLLDFTHDNPGLKVVCKKNDINLGVDYNCHIAIHAGTGEFCWLLCDDDRLEKGGLRIIFDSCVNSPSVAFAYIDYQIESNGSTHVSGCTAKGIHIINGVDFFGVTKLASSFASSCVFKRNRLDIEKNKKYIGTKWYHLYVTRDCISLNDVLIIGLPLITQISPPLKNSRAEKRRTDTGGLEFYISAHLNICEFVNTLKHTIFCDTRCKWTSLQKIVKRDNIYQIINYKLTSKTYFFHEIFFISRAMCIMFPFKISLWFIELPLLYMPNSVFEKIYLVLRHVNKLRKLIVRRFEFKY